MVRMNFIFIFISSSDPNLLRKKSVKQKIKKTLALVLLQGEISVLAIYAIQSVLHRNAEDKKFVFDDI